MRWAMVLLALALAGCDTGTRFDTRAAPGAAGFGSADHLLIGHRLMAAREYEQALKSYHRSMVQRGSSPEVLAALGTANLALGRLGQAEPQLRRAWKERPEDAELMNNLGVLLIETNRPGEAVQMFRRAFAASNGRSEQIRDNLSKALAMVDDSGYSDPDKDRPQLVVRGTGDVLLITQ